MHRWADRFFYWPDKTDRGDPGDADLAFEDVAFSANGGPELHGWFLPAARGRAVVGTAVQFHGNAGNITGHYQLAGWLPAFGFNVLCFDYRGYGRSDGEITRQGSIADARASLDYVKTRPEVDPETVVVLGQSIGGAIAATVCAGRRDIRAVVLDCPFSGYREVARHALKRTIVLWPAAWLIARSLLDPGPDPIDCVADIAPVPLMITQCTADEVLDHRMSELLYERADEPKRLHRYEGAGHCRQLFNTDCMEQARDDMVGFFLEALGRA